jgi:hypothetical protein
MKSIELRPRPFARNSPSSGSIAAFAKWNITDAFRLAAFLAFICATGELVVNLGGSDQKQYENCGDRESHDEEKDTPVGNEVAEEAH